MYARTFKCDTEAHGEQLEKGQAEGVVLVLGAALRLP